MVAGFDLVLCGAKLQERKIESAKRVTRLRRI